MKINLDVDINGLKRQFLELEKGERRLAYGVSQAIRSTLLQAQKDVRERVAHTFTVRKPEFLLRQAAIINPFPDPRQARPFGEISVGKKPRLILGQYEAGGLRQPVKGKASAVPIVGSPARPTFSSPVPDAFQFSKLRLSKTRPVGPAPITPGRRRKRSRSNQSGIRYGLQGTYQIDGVGVFQRFGVDHRDTRLLYPFVKDEKLKPELEFVKTVETSAGTWFRPYLEDQLTQSILHARGRA